MTERTESRRVDKFHGRGFLSRNDKRLTDVEYDVVVWQDFLISRAFNESSHETPGLKDFEIRLEFRQLDAAIHWAGPEILTLHFEDGRSIQGFLNGDRFVPSGSLIGASR